VVQNPSDTKIATMHTKRILQIVIPMVTVLVLLLIVLLALVLKHRRAMKKHLLPISEKPQQTFLEHHLAGLRNWQKPKDAPTERSSDSIKVDPSHLSLHLAQPSPTHQAPRKLNWREFQERSRRRQLDRQNSGPLEPFHLKPKPASYWHKVYEEQEARKSWWEKLREKMGR
jgi:hypothetical protein